MNERDSPTAQHDIDWLARWPGDRPLPPPDRRERLNRVVVTGAGPTGLTAALTLAQAGIAVTVLEKLPTLSGESRASTFHPATLELLDRLGLAGDVIAAGLRAPTTQFRDRSSGPVATFDLGVLADETDFPFRIQLEQSKFTPMVVERLRRGVESETLDVELRFGHRTHSAAPTADDGAVSLMVGTDSGLVEMTADWVIAADGAHSAVRQSLDIDLLGEEYPERFLVVSVADDLTQDLDDLAYVNYVADPDEWLVLLRTPDHWRVLFPIADAAGSDDEVLSDESVHRLLAGVADRDPSRRWTVLDRSLYVVSRRVATTMRAGRVLLAGDAAHQNSPLGGMGMNSGIQDAVSAGTRLARVIAGESDSLLDEYDRLRRDVAVGYVQTDSHANWLVLREPDPDRRARLQADLSNAAADPTLHAERMRRSAMLESIRASL